MTTTLNASTAGAGGFIATSDNSGSLALQTAGTTAITVDASQQVGIGGTPVKTLSILPTSIRRMDFYVRDPGVDDSLVIRSQHATNNNIRDMILEGSIVKVFTGADSGGSGSERMRIDSSGNALFGTTSSTPIGSGVQGVAILNAGRIDINKTSDAGLYIGRQTTTGALVNFYYGGAGPKGSISTDGTNVAYNTSSDYRLKENIAPMTGALAKVAQLKPVTYKWKADGSDGEGFIAHELAEVCPHAVSGAKDAIDEDGNPQYQGIDVSFLVATLTAALQETKALIDTQAETINALTARIVALESRGTV